MVLVTTGDNLVARLGSYLQLGIRGDNLVARFYGQHCGRYAKLDLTSQKVLWTALWAVHMTRPDFSEGFMDSTVGGTHDRT